MTAPAIHLNRADEYAELLAAREGWLPFSIVGHPATYRYGVVNRTWPVEYAHDAALAYDRFRDAARAFDSVPETWMP